MIYERVLKIISKEFNVSLVKAEEWLETLERQGRLNDFLFDLVEEVD